MMQGDSYSMAVYILNNETPVTPEDVQEVEITVSHITKTYSSGAVIYDPNEQRWLFPLTQEETFGLPAIRVKAQIRVMWADGSVEGVELDGVEVAESISKEVL